MDKLERFIMPLILIIGISAILLTRANPDHVVVLARVVGIFLGIVLGGAFFFRLLGMYIRYRAAKRIIEETHIEIARLRILADQEDAEAQKS
ncbi:MAG: hypothetical protein ACI97A_002356 [Planctomycetota bacterium]|jgi:hypothetical protein